MAANRLVAELWCFEVLERLSGYLDGELSEGSKAQVEAHLAQCAECTRFGGEFGQVITALRSRLSEREGLPDDVARRLTKSLLG